MSRPPLPGRDTLLGQAVTFGVVGVGTLVLDYALYRGLIALGTPFSVAKVCGFVVGTTAAYLVNRTVTFKHAGGGRAVVAFLCLYAVTLVLNVAVNEAALHVLDGVTGRITWAFLLAQAVTSTANFVGMRQGVFRPAPDDDPGGRRATDPPGPGLGLTGPPGDAAGRGPRP